MFLGLRWRSNHSQSNGIIITLSLLPTGCAFKQLQLETSSYGFLILHRGAHFFGFVLKRGGP